VFTASLGIYTASNHDLLGCFSNPNSNTKKCSPKSEGGISWHSPDPIHILHHFAGAQPPALEDKRKVTVHCSLRREGQRGLGFPLHSPLFSLIWLQFPRALCCKPCPMQASCFSSPAQSQARTLDCQPRAPMGRGACAESPGLRVPQGCASPGAAAAPPSEQLPGREPCHWAVCNTPSRGRRKGETAPTRKTSPRRALTQYANGPVGETV
jgi:hypothetical protein